MKAKEGCWGSAAPCQSMYSRYEYIGGGADPAERGQLWGLGCNGTAPSRSSVQIRRVARKYRASKQPMSPLTLHLTGRLWTADGVLKNGLRSAEFDRLFRGIAKGV